MAKSAIVSRKSRPAHGTARAPNRKQITIVLTTRQFNHVNKQAKASKISFAEAIRQTIDSTM